MEVGGLEACSGIHTPTFLCLRTFAKDLFIRPLQKPNNAPLSSAIRHLPDLSLHGGLGAWPLHHPHPSPTKALLHLLYCLLRRGRTYRINRTYRTAADAACTTHPSVAGALLNLFNLLCAFAPYLGTSQTCRGCRENFSLPGRGAAPHSFSIYQSLCVLCGSLCPLWKTLWLSCRRQPAPNLPKSVRYRKVFLAKRRNICGSHMAVPSPEATARASTSGAPPSFQASKLPDKKEGPRADARGPLGKRKSRRRATLPRANPAVPSPMRPFTSVFGMGTGVSSSLWPPGKQSNVSGSATCPEGGFAILCEVCNGKPVGD